MRIVVCIKEVLDPDAVNNYALAGRLEIGEDGKSLTQTTIPQLMNGFDEQAIEAALRIRDAGVECTLCVVSVGADPSVPLRHAAALGADEVATIAPPSPEPDSHTVAQLLAGYIRSLGGADLVLCGRQASDDDQGVVPALVGELLDMPVVAIARAVEQPASGTLRVTRVTPDGDEIVETSTPALVTISNELGDPRYPTAASKLKARRVQPKALTAEELALEADALAPRVALTRQFVPTVQGNCEFITGDSPAELADRLVARLREDKLLA
ncbi:MAG: electron transfer flavoprotein subunit beta/FixA family protein [Myxococcota bacterium]|nr:electron transfer flavoprotein subunit beta/FixA family protein [Myxococcota bacterium]